MRIIQIAVAGKTYEIKLEESVAAELKNAISQDLNLEGNNSVKSLLEAYLKKNYENFLLKKRLHELLQKLQEIEKE